MTETNFLQHRGSHFQHLLSSVLSNTKSAAVSPTNLVQHGHWLCLIVSSPLPLTDYPPPFVSDSSNSPSLPLYLYHHSCIRTLICYLPSHLSALLHDSTSYSFSLLCSLSYFLLQARSHRDQREEEMESGNANPHAFIFPALFSFPLQLLNLSPLNTFFIYFFYLLLPLILFYNFHPPSSLNFFLFLYQHFSPSSFFFRLPSDLNMCLYSRRQSTKLFKKRSWQMRNRQILKKKKEALSKIHEIGRWNKEEREERRETSCSICKPRCVSVFFTSHQAY